MTLKQNYYVSLHEISIRHSKTKKDKPNYPFNKIKNINKEPNEDIYLKFTDILKNIFEESGPIKCSKEDKIIEINMNSKYSKKDIVCGFIYYGKDRKNKKKYEWENISNVEEIKSNNIIAEEYYFMFKLPDEKEKGALVLERKGVSGIYTILTKVIRSKIKKYDKYKHVKINLKANKFPKENQKFVERGEVVNLKYYYDKIGQDIADDEEEGTMILSVKFKERKKLDQIKEITKESLKYGKPSKTDATLEYEGDKRTVNVDNPAEIFASINITKKLEIEGIVDDNNIPIETWNKIAEEIINNNYKDVWKQELV